jgi:hypothetical protein
MSWLILQALWVGYAALIIAIDRAMIERPVNIHDPDSVDLRDRSYGSYLVFMAVFGAFLIPFYLWGSRRSALAVIIGIGLIPIGAIVVALLTAAIV